MHPLRRWLAILMVAAFTTAAIASDDAADQELRADLQQAAQARKAGDHERAFALMLPWAERGNALAQEVVAQSYLRGQGTGKDPDKAIHWLTRAAEQGRTGAQGTLGLIYERGQIVERDHEASVRWFKLAARDSNPRAQTALDWHYEKGAGVRQSERLARRWYRRAADQGHPGAELELRDDKIISSGDISDAIAAASQISEIDSDAGLSYRNFLKDVE